jgi:hypothetical protein
MSGKITHIESLNQVMKQLEHGNSTQRKISQLLKREEVRNYANLGSVAPDMFYFYHVLTPKRTRKASIWGDRSHHEKVADLILNFLDRVADSEFSLYRDRNLAFTLGYLCHCVVDIITHPYIFYISGDYYNIDPKIAFQAQLAHMRVEYGLDSFLIHHRWGMTAKEYDFPQHIDITVRTGSSRKKMDTMLWKFWVDCLQETFPSEFRIDYIGSQNKILTGDILNESYLGFFQMSKIVDSRSMFVRGFLKFVDKITFKKANSSVLLLPLKENIDPRIMNEEKREWSYPALPSKKSNETFIELLNYAVSLSKDMLTLAYEYVESPTKKNRDNLHSKFSGYNLDTGLKEGVHQMKEFAPLG